MWILGTTLTAALNLLAGNLVPALVLGCLAAAELAEQCLEHGAPLNPLTR